jgi:hypothetical protein
MWIAVRKETTLFTDRCESLSALVCGVFLANARRSLNDEGIAAAVRNHDTAALFDWLVGSLTSAAGPGCVKTQGLMQCSEPGSSANHA